MYLRNIEQNEEKNLFAKKNDFTSQYTAMATLRRLLRMPAEYRGKENCILLVTC